MRAGAARKERALLLAPAALLLALVVGWPIARVVALSFTRTELDGGISIQPAGLEPYVRLWHDPRWWSALSNTAVFATASVVFELALGTAFAFLLHRRFRGRGFVRALVVLPWALPTAVMALAWAWIFNDSFGVLNDVLGRAGLIGAPIAWLGTPWGAMSAMIVADVWKTTPFVTLIVLAGLQAVPESVLEAAQIDGLSSAQTARRIVLPLIAPSLLVAVAFRLVQATGAFDLPYVLTAGGPAGSTETISLYAYQNDFRYLDFGYGSAIAVQGAILCAVPILALMRWAARSGGR